MTSTWLIKAVSIGALKYDFGEVFSAFCIIAIVFTNSSQLEQLILRIALPAPYTEITRLLASPACGEIHVGVFLPFMLFPVPYVLLGLAVGEFTYCLTGITPELLEDLAGFAGRTFCKDTGGN
jgi:hypothetical protein